MKLKYLLLIIFLISVSGILNAATYYVDSNGNDSNNGLSTSTPWQTLSKINSFVSSFIAGDQILFRRGDKFIGQITFTKPGNSANPIVFGSYGTGNLPIISGAKIITGWTVYSGNIYRTSISDTISNLYVDRKLVTIARYPNSGWLRIDIGNGTNGFYDAALTMGSGYFDGGNCRVRTTNWSYETKKIANFSGGNVIYSSPSQYSMSTDYGYYMDNKLNLLDIEKEWYNDIVNDYVYLYAPNGVNPNTLLVEGVAYKKGFFLNSLSNYVNIQDLNITKYKESSVEFLGSNNNKIQNCLINQNDKIGIFSYGNNHTIYNNLIEDNLDRGIVAYVNNGSFTNNIINRTGLVAGYGQSGWGYIGVSIEVSNGTLLSNNIIDSSGYSGIVASSNNIIEKNIVSYSCLTLNDGGGITFDNVDGLQVKNNLITHSIGNTESVPSTNYVLANGIFFGNTSIKNILVQGNTIAYNRFTGIYVDHTPTSNNYQILDNVLYNNFDAQMIISDLSAPVFKPVYNHVIKGNIFYSLSWEQQAMVQQMYHSTLFSDFGFFDSNYYCNPYNEHVITRTIVSPYINKEYRLSKWKSELNKDLNSKSSLVAFEQYRVTDTIGVNLVNNSTFNNLNNWHTWPSGSTIAQTIHPLLDAGCMRIRWNGIGFTQNVITSNTFPVTKGNFYLATISCVGNNTGDFTFWMQPNSLAGIYDLGLTRICNYENYRRNHSFIFEADTTDPVTKYAISMFLPDSLLYVDNAYLYRVAVEKVDSTELSRLFTNPTNSSVNVSLGGIMYKDLDGNVITGSVALPPYTSKVLVQNIIKTLQLTVLIQGLYNSGTNSTIQDTVRAYLRNTSSPYTIIDSSIVYSNSSGLGTFNFSGINNNAYYYLHVKHRNSIETWSKNPISFANDQSSYDFTTAAAQAYGNNLILKGAKYCIYSGDVNQDGFVDGSDLASADNNASNYTFGYISTDVNGDNLTDASDLLIIDNNASNTIVKITP